MNMLDFPSTISEKIQRLLGPMIATAKRRPNLQSAEQWKKHVHDKIEAWRAAPEELEDDGVETPAPVILDLANSVADELLDLAIEPPNIVVPNGVGGIVFRWRVDASTWSLEIENDGSIEANLLANGKLTWRHSLHQLSANES